MEEIKLIIVDLFCGAGGLSTGAERAGEKVIACVNHDLNAIASHKMNHPDVIHFREDIRTLDIYKILVIVNKYRAKYPNAKLLLWASLECTNFSIAKGGMSRDADSRLLAEELHSRNGGEVKESYIQILNPDIVYIENVKEFLTYGPLIQKRDKLGKLMWTVNKKSKVKKPVMIPDPKFKGSYFNRWRDTIENLGYQSEYKLLNSKNYGACQSRLRLFMQFVRDGISIEWPEPTHGKAGSGLLPYRPVKEVLDLNNHGISIFNRSLNKDIPKRQQKELVEKTLERIYAGLVKWVAKGNDSFISKYYSGKPEQKNIPVYGPAGTIKTIDGQAVVKCVFITKYMGNNVKTGINNGIGIDEPCVTIPTSDRLGLVQTFGIKYHGSGENLNSVDEPSSTMSTKDRIGLVRTIFIDQQFGASKPASANEPLGTITTNPKYNVVNAVWIDRAYSEGTPTNTIDNPSDTVTSVTKLSVVKCFIMNTHFNNIGQSINEPSCTLTADRHHNYYVMVRGWDWGMSSVEKSSPTVIARQDKSPLYLVETEFGDMGIMVFENDSPATEKIKLFMAAYGIVDIKMRMLTIREQKQIQGFDPDYILKGTMTEQKKYNGNAVEVNMGEACIRAAAFSREFKEKVA